ncbi:hypothetical protein [Paludibaculum fermentans]|uniref:Uncharacterized protein n=1 Tax=Paludibaculum fermentans TaxID=1473598 RepID=A0A7S7SPP6_PALFE|nr:hypothetical protein [Paludibaculum fermentans]QOY91375.1 hypothetical protein IRI77_15920 [Paludibaculum fermentans]
MASSRSLSLAILAALLIFGANSCRLASKSEILIDSRALGTAERIVLTEEGGVTPGRIEKEFARFAAELPPGTTFAHLLMGSPRSHLQLGMNTTGLADSRPGFDEIQGWSTRELGEVFRSGQDATVRIMKGHRVSIYNIAGNHDARMLNVAGEELQIIGLRGLPTAWTKKEMEKSRTGTENLRLFLRAKKLPENSKALEIVTTIRATAGLDVITIIRTDAFFSAYSGPSTDIFSAQDEAKSIEEIRQGKYLACVAAGQLVRCRSDSLAYPNRKPLYFDEETK